MKKIIENANDLEDENIQLSKTNNKESLQPTDKENDSDEKDNLVNPQHKEITRSDDTITSSDGIIIIQKSESSKTKADEAVADKAESNASFQPVDIQKKIVTPNSSGLYSEDSLQTPLQVLSESSSTTQEMKAQNERCINHKTLTDDDN